MSIENKDSDRKSPPRIVISAPHRSSGKTTVSIGVCAALADAGYRVQPFKKGPDFIDPMWLTSATGRECRNLDYFMMGDANIVRSFHKASHGAEISIIEGNMGLFDGMEEDGKGSTADLARLLDAAVVLVVDASKMTRSIAPLINGFRYFEPGTRVSGVVLNRVSSPRHESKLRAAIGRYCDIEVVGAIPRLHKMEILQRHLGLRPSREESEAVTLVETIRDVVKEHVDLESLFRIGASGSFCLQDDRPDIDTLQRHPSVKLGVARDRAFTFYYPENLEALEAAGAELVFFSPISDTRLPEVDGLYIGGGFPEVFMAELEENRAIREQIRDAIEKGMPVYAECGGLMYLSRTISWNGKTNNMVDALPCDVVMRDKPKGHGYIRLKTLDNGWFESGTEIRAHEFHYSETAGLKDVGFAYEILRGSGVDGRHDGIIYKNVLASYAHLHSLATPQWAGRFVAYVQKNGLDCVSKS